MLTPSRSRRFIRALFDEIGANSLRWTSIDSVAERAGIDHEEAQALAVEVDGQDLVRVGGGHSATLTEAGRQMIRKRPR